MSDSPQFERITAADIEVGDYICEARNHDPFQVTGFGPSGASSRYIEIGTSRIRPRYTKKFWRVKGGLAKVVRRARLAKLAERCSEGVYDTVAAAAINGGVECPRYALFTSEGSPESAYAHNQNLTVHESIDSMAVQASSEFDEGWAVRSMHDLDTGAELGWNVRVEVVV